MEHAFWHDRWSQNQIGFHQSDFNQWLRKHWGSLGAADDSAVLVPLCGKSKDGVDLERVMSNSFGFGGTNSTLVFEKYKG